MSGWGVSCPTAGREPVTVHAGEAERAAATGRIHRGARDPAGAWRVRVQRGLLHASLPQCLESALPSVPAHDQWSLHGVSIARGGAVGFGLRVVDKLARDTQEASARLNHALPQRGERIYEIMGRGKQSPNRESRVTIVRERDRLGMPVSELNWQVRRADLVNIRTSLETIGNGLAATGAGRLHMPIDPEMAWAQRITGSWHHMGTTRMDADPKTGVVDADGRMDRCPTCT